MPRLLVRLFGFLLLSIGLAVPAGAAQPGVRLEMGQSQTARFDGDSPRVGFAIELRNRGADTAGNVRVVAVRVTQGRVIDRMPLLVGNIPPGEAKVVQFVADVPVRAGRTPVQLDLSYVAAKRRDRAVLTTPVDVSINRPTPIKPRAARTPIQRPGRVKYPPVRDVGKPELPNAETPMLIPPGPRRRVTPIPTTGTGIKQAVPGGSISIPVNTNDRTNAGTPPDPSGASSGVGGVVLATYNSGIAFSVNGGTTFTDVNLVAPVAGQPGRNSFFPQDDNGLCCDQVVIYLPQQDIFVWLLQYSPITACVTNCTPVGPTSTFGITQPNRLRVAWATPAQIRTNFFNAWTYADLTTQGLGAANNEWLDYPDLGFSGRFLYVGVDHGFPTPGQVYAGRRIVARLSLADMVNPSATSVGYQFAEYTGSAGLNKNHFIQNAPGRMVVGSLDSGAKLRVFTWDDGSATIPAPNIVDISTIQTGTYTSGLADGSDWVAVGFPGNITGGTYRRVAQFGASPREEYMFAFTAGTDGAGRPRPFVRLETLTPTGATTYSVSEEYDIFNPDYAYAVAAVGSGTNIVLPEIGLSLFVGGGTIGYPRGVVGFKNDFVVYTVNDSDAAQGVRFGDYVNARPIPGTASRFGTQTYSVRLPAGSSAGATCATAGCSANMNYVEFERPPPDPIR